MQKINFLRKLNTNVIQKRLWGFDIETYGRKNRFLLCSIVGDKGINKTFWEKEDFLSYLRNKGKKIFSGGYITATNLQFDILGLLQDTETFKDFKPLTRNGNFISAKIYIYRNNKSKHILSFIDTQNYCNFSVKEWGKILKFPKLPQPKCFTRKPKNSEEEIELEKYNIRDSEITYRAIKLIQKGVNNLNGNLKITSATCAMDIYRRNYQPFTYFQPNRKILDFLFKGYTGGRVEIIKRGAVSNLNYYDFNSLYPSVMMKEYPNPNSFKFLNKIDMHKINNYEGIADVEITAPKMYIPYLPCRIAKPEAKLIFPYGKFRGNYTFFEIREAVKLGYEIRKFHSGIIYFKTFYPFKDYVDNLFRLRRKQKKENNPLEVITKRELNSLYGKWAQNIREKYEYVHESKVTMEMLNKCDRPIRKGMFFILNTPVTKIPSFVNPIFSIYTTAYARDVLFKTIEKCRDDIYYYDTDSLMTKRYFETSDNIGELKFEMKINDGILIKPKMYIINDNAKCKGFGSMSKEEFLRFIAERQRKITRFAKFKESNRRGLQYNETIEFIKVVGLEDNKRMWGSKFHAYNLQNSGALNVC